MKTLSEILSVVFHPILSLFYAVLMVCLTLIVYGPDPFLPLPYIIIAVTFFCSVLMPLSSFLVMHRFKLISSLEMPSHEERCIPYIVSFIFLAVNVYLLGFLGFPIEVTFILKGSLLALFLMAVINVRWKISAHACGMGAITTFSYLLSFMTGNSFVSLFLIVLLLSGFVGSARLHLQRHTLGQVIAGYTIGVFFPFSFWVIYQLII